MSKILGLASLSFYFFSFYYFIFSVIGRRLHCYILINMQHIEISKLTNHKVFEHKICYQCSFKSQCNFLRTTRFNVNRFIIDIASLSAIFFNIQIENYVKYYFLWYSFLIIRILSLACHMQNTNIFTFFLGVHIHFLIY